MFSDGLIVCDGDTRTGFTRGFLTGYAEFGPGDCVLGGTESESESEYFEGQRRGAEEEEGKESRFIIHSQVSAIYRLICVITS